MTPQEDPGDRVQKDLDAVLEIAALPPRKRTEALVRSVLSPAFVQSHPSLVQMLTSERLNPSILEMIVAKFRGLASGAVSQETASADVGQRLAEAYIPACSDSS